MKVESIEILGIIGILYFSTFINAFLIKVSGFNKKEIGNESIKRENNNPNDILFFIKFKIFNHRVLKYRNFCFKITSSVPALGVVANFGTDYFLLKIKFLAKCKHEFTTKFAILPNACCMQFLSFFFVFSKKEFYPF